MLRFGKNDFDFLPEHFIIFLPKVIIGGDFYRFYKTNRGFISVMMDCTGHGVPGALMSVLGMSLIDEIVLQEKIERPDMILNRLSKKLTLVLDQGKGDSSVMDGMEGLIINFDRRSYKISFSGSFNNLLLVRKRRLIEIKADRRYIGCGFNNSKFNLKEVAIEKDDCMYAFSDGYIDQFGGNNNKKFLAKRFRKLLLDINHESICIQKERLLDTLNNWKGDNEQTDDIIVIGYRY